jgi:hypothetical protein
MREPVEIVAIAVPVLLELVVVMLLICSAVVWLAIWCGA